MTTIESLVDLARQRAHLDIGYTFLGRDGAVEECSYRRLDARARDIGAALAERGLRGERLLLMYPPGLDFVTAFFGCLYAGAVAVPVFPPDPARLDRTLPRVTGIAMDARPAAVLTTAPIAPLLAALAEQTPGLSEVDTVATDETPDGIGDGWRPPAIAPETTALIQYTSGSTAQPRGVLLDHRNLLHNSSLIREAFGTSADTRALSWLPLYHDMGLIGGILQPLLGGFPIALMSPLDFLARPLSWLEAVSRWRITTSGGPNFAYDLCVRRLDPARAPDLDLSTWRVAFNGAEPVRPDTLDRFAEAFGPYGFDREAFLPCYGLAEATLIVTGKRRSETARVLTVDPQRLGTGTAVDAADPDRAVRLVSSGRVLGDQEVTVIDPGTGATLAADTVGEICVQGPSVGRGYWGRPADTAQVFGAAPGGPRLRTGDLGFLRAGELYVTGRRKDVVIVRGRNVYPQDLERTAVAADPRVRPGGAAAFGVPGTAGEHVVLVAEVAATVDAAEAGTVAEAVRLAIAGEHDVPVDAVVLIPPGTLPKTSSGKVRRGACRVAYEGGTLVVVGRSATPATDPSGGDHARPDGLRDLPGPQRPAAVGGYLRHLLGAATGLPPDRLTDDLGTDALGLDSLAAVDVLHRIERGTGVRLPIPALTAAGTVGELTDLVLAAFDAVPDEDAPRDGAPAADGAVVPMSPQQRALWFLAQLAPESSAYHLTRAFTVDPDASLDPEALDRSLCLLVGRHEALRTVFPSQEGRPAARLIDPPTSVLRVLPVADDAVDAELRRAAGHPFDLGRGPLLRAVLLVPATGPRVLLFAVHHLVMDLWSAGVLARELRTVYRSLVAGQPVVLPPVPGHGEALRRLSAGWAARAPELRRYWRRQLAGELPVLALPDGRPRPAAQTFRGAVVRHELPPSVGASVDRLAADAATTRYVVLLAALQVLLRRYGDQDDVLIGTPVATRRDPELGGTVGYLLNTLVLRGNLGDDPTFSALLSRDRATVRDAVAHQDMPFPVLVEELVAGRDPAHTPLFQVMLTHERVPGGDELGALAVDPAATRLDLGGVRLTGRPLPERSAAFDLTLRVASVAGRLVTSWEYNTDVLTEVAVARLAHQYEWLLAEAAARPHTRLSALSTVTPEQRRELLAWTDSAAPPPPDRCVHDVILERAAHDPAAIAVRGPDGELSYRELVEQAGALAGELRGRGVGPEVRVAVLLPTAPGTVVAILAVLLAGGAYVPVDPATPPARCALLLADARPRLVITDAKGRDQLPAGVSALCPDELHLAPSAAPPPAARPHHLAYVIYTSGSTGRPKGIEVSHANLMHSTHARLGYFPDRVRSFLLISSLGFDSSLAGLFWTLYEGGTLVLPEPHRYQDPEHHRELLRRYRVSHFESVPSLYLALLRLLRPGEVPDLRSVVVAGEACPREVYDRHRAVLPQARLVNEYGPAEGTVWCSAYRVGPDPRRRTLPIGRPIANTTLYLLDRHGRLTPPGAVGELYLGGSGVARGYHGRPDLTAERFLPDPFATAPGSRLYRTGDLARLLDTGELEFVGRVDRQVKVNGVRVELGEVEAVLRDCPGVADAAVRATAGPRGDRVLVGYLVAVAPGAPPSTHRVRGFLLERLTTAMVPTRLVWLPSLPLTPHGKVDDAALPAPRWDDGTTTAIADAADPIAQALRELFADLLGRAPVGVDDDFFAAGGHSLLVTQLVSRVRAVFGVEIGARDVFAAATPRRLAEQIRRARSGPVPAATAPPVPGSADDIAPLSYTQQRLWFIDRLTPDSPAYHMPVAVRLRGPLDRSALADTLTAVVARHAALRTVFANTENGPVQRVLPAAAFPLGYVDAVTLSGPVDAELAAAATRPFDLATGPPIRGTLYRLGPDEHVLLLVIHHIVADGWSLAVLTSEVAAGYQARVRREPDPVPAPSLRYVDYAAWQRHRDPEPVREQVAEAAAGLADAPMLRLPTDRPRPVVQRFTGDLQRWRLPAGTVAALRQVCRETGATLFMVLLAGFGATLGRRAYSDDFVIGTPISGRTHLEMEDLIGFFANTLALRLDLTGDPTFAELVGRVREVCLDAYRHQEVPFELLVEHLQPVRDLGRNPLFQVIFALQNTPRPTPELTGLEVELLDVPTGTAKFDLTVSLWEAGDELHGTFEYSTDLFDGETVAHLVDDFTGLLCAVGADSGRPLSRIFPAVPEPAELTGDPLPAAPGTPVPDPIPAGVRAVLALGADDRVAVSADLPDETSRWLSAAVRAAGAGLVAPDPSDGLRAAVERHRPTLVCALTRELPILAGTPTPRLVCVDTEPPRPAQVTGPVPFLPATPAAGAGTVWSLDDGRWRGRPLPGITVRVRDRHGNPVPAGVPGQLHVSAGSVDRPTDVLVRLLPDRTLQWLGPLRPPPPDTATHDRPYTAPRTPVEEVVATIWADVVDAERIGVHDDFFALGGHSLLAMQVITRLGAVFQIEVPVRALFEDPTVAGLAQCLTDLEPRPGQVDRIARIWQQVRAGEGGPDGR